MLHSCPLTLSLLPFNLPPLSVPQSHAAPFFPTKKTGTPFKFWPRTILSDLSCLGCQAPAQQCHLSSSNPDSPAVPPPHFLSPVEKLPWEQRKLLRWKMSTVTPNIVKQTIGRSHFKISKSELPALLRSCPLPQWMGSGQEETLDTSCCVGILFWSFHLIGRWLKSLWAGACSSKLEDRELLFSS